jgi:hypothetical protein
MENGYEISNVECSLKTLATELAKCKLDLVRVQEVRWEQDGTEPTIIYFSMEMGMIIINKGQDFSYKGILIS